MKPIDDMHLSDINTEWQLVYQAHNQEGQAEEAQRLLLERYGGAVSRYLLGALRDEEAMRELYQEFALRLVRGDFRRVNPENGRFRHYLKKALVHLIADYKKRQASAPGSLPANVSQREVKFEEEEFTDCWRSKLLDRSWDVLADVNRTYFTVLKLHISEPDVAASEKSEQASQILGTDFDANRFRVTLHRAREKFAELLVKEVARSLSDAGEAELQRELRELRLMEYCASAMQRRMDKAAGK